ncbi:MAG TPA: ArsA family ATPase [Acidimicrobiales bacterium]|nr:ArsA family ATPase [Acidimicrobiales bacterium]
MPRARLHQAARRPAHCRHGVAATTRPRRVARRRAVLTRILLFTGKGGVGKTTVSAATALACAEQGERVLVMSTDPAHSLADAFDADLGSTPTRILAKDQGFLDGMQLDATQRLEAAWGDIQRYIAELLEWVGLVGIEAEELAVIPGLDEVFSLGDIRAAAHGGSYDTIVVDCGPTAETIRFLSLPEILSWYIERVVPIERRVTSVLRPLLSAVTSIPIAGDSVFDAATRFLAQLEGVRELLTDGERASVRLVVNPERMVIAEARRTATYLNLFGYHLDAVIANKLLPDDVTDPWFASWKTTHTEHLKTIEADFAPLPVLRAQLASAELTGVDGLRTFAASLYGEIPPASLLHREQPLRFDREGGVTTLFVRLPFATRDDLDVARSGNELLIRVGPQRRRVVLPDSLQRRAVASARLIDDELAVTFCE